MDKLLAKINKELKPLFKTLEIIKDKNQKDILIEDIKILIAANKNIFDFKVIDENNTTKFIWKMKNNYYGFKIDWIF